MRFLCGVKVARMWIVLGIYALFMLWITWHWGKWSRPSRITRHQGRLHVSVLIPARNEAENLPQLIDDLKAQKSGSVELEVVVIDDHSEDDTRLVCIEAFGPDDRFSIISLKEKSGKKAALSEGMRVTSGELVVTLDADVRVGSEWLECLTTFHRNNRSQLIILPVMYTRRSGLIGLLQVPEMLCLQAITAATVNAGNPVMCNGANLAFRRTARERVGITEGDAFSSGDDMFLLHGLKKKSIGPIHWLHDPRAIAQTNAPESVLSIFSQRVRWASKSSGYRDGLLIFLTGLMVLTNLAAVLLVILACAGAWQWREVMLWYLVKTAFELALLIPVAYWYSRMKELLFVPFVAIIYPWYALAVAIGSLAWRPEWKGRKVSLANTSRL